MELFVIGFNHHTASVDVRERCTLNPEGYRTLLYRLLAHPSIRAVVILATCNRLEIYADVTDSLTAQTVITDHLHTQFDVPIASLYSYNGQAMATHLLRVACGLDSMVLGEAQILGQVSDAYQVAQSHHALTPTLHRVFMSALQTGKRAHKETPIHRHTTSVSHIALTIAPNIGSVLIIGAGEMAQHAAQAAHDRHIPHIHVINRTDETAVMVAKRVAGQAHPWSALWEMVAQVDAVISATGAPHAILQAHRLQTIMAQRQTPLILVDIALPRDVEPSARHIPNICLYDMDDIQQVVDDHVRQRQACVPYIEHIIAQECDLFMAWWRGRDIVPTITDLRQKVGAIAQMEVDDTMRRLSHLDSADLHQIQRLAHRLVNKILHEPTLALRHHAQLGDADAYSRVVRDLFALITPDEDVSIG